jgi:hypothetical protein
MCNQRRSLAPAEHSASRGDAPETRVPPFHLTWAIAVPFSPPQIAAKHPPGRQRPASGLGAGDPGGAQEAEERRKNAESRNRF